MARNRKTRQSRGGRGKHKASLEPSIGPHAKTGLEFRENVATIKADDLDRLRTSEDFIDLVRVMRLSNILNYAFNSVVNAADRTSSAGRLAYERSHFNLGGYLHESVELLDKLKKRHSGKSYFSRAKRTLDSMTVREKEILKLFRNKAAFHLDQSDYITRNALKKLVLKDWEFLAADSSKRKDQYYVFADVVDLNYIIDSLKNFGGAPDSSLYPDEEAYEAAIGREIYEVLIRVGPEMASATSEMAFELAKRLGLLK